MSSPLPRNPLWKWWVCGLLLLATMVNYMDRLTINLLAKRVMGEFALDEGHYGQLESAFAFAFALGAIVMGWMADRWSVRWLYAFAVLAWSAAGFATGLATTFTGLLVCRFLLGLAEAGNWPCALRTTQKILSPSERTMGNGILQCGAAVGAVITPFLVSALVLEPARQDSAPWVSGMVATFASAGGPEGGFASLSALACTPVYVPGAWRLPFLVIGAAGASWVILWLLAIRKEDLALQPRISPSLIGIVGWLVCLFCLDIAAQLSGLRNPWLVVGLKGGIGILGVVAVARWLLQATAADSSTETLPRPLFVRRYLVVMTLVVAVNVPWHFFRAWMPLFLQNQHGFGERATNQFNAAYYLSTDLGSLVVGFITLRLVARGFSVHTSRLSVFMTCAVLTSLSIPAAFIRDTTLLLGLLLVVGFACLGLFPTYYSFSQSLTTAHQGKVTGSLGCINWLAMYVLQAGVGELVKQTRSYSLGVAAVGLVPLLGTAVLLLFWGKDPGNPRAVENTP